MRRFGSWLLVLLTATIGLGACDSCKDAPVPKEADSSAATHLAEEADVGSIHVEQLTPEALFPVISAPAFEGFVPEKVVVQFGRNVIDDAPRTAADATVFRIEPSLDGALEFVSGSNLEFRPSDDFLPNSSYKVTLESVESREGPMIPAAPWSAEFQTPDFAFIGLSTGVMDETKKTVEVDVRFSAPISPEELTNFATWRLDGEKVSSANYTTSYRRNVARAFLWSPNVKAGAKLELELDEGFPYKNGIIQAPAATASVELEAGAPVTVHHAHHKEGPTGFYVEVVCNDDAAPGGYRYYYSSDDSWRISRRCLLTDESARSHVSIHPKVDFKVSSGQGGFNIVGDFARGNYVVRVGAGARTVDGGVVKSSFESAISIPSRSPDLSFSGKGRYIPKSAWSKLPLTHLNVAEAEVTVRHIPERNVLFWLGEYREDANDRTSVMVAKDRIKLAGKADEQTTSFIDVARLIEKPAPGVYEVTIEGLGKRDSIRLVPTDLNLVVKTSAPKPDQSWGEEVFAWAIDMKTAKPVPGVTIEVVRQSGDALAKCESDGDGFCQLTLATDTLDKSAPYAVLARREGDFTYLSYSDLRTTPKDAPIGGVPYLGEAAYSAAIYGDRDVYRPGETGHFVAILRDEKFMAPQAEVPVELQIIDPQQKTLRKKIVRTNDAGMVALDHDFADFATTGFHTLTLTVGKKKVSSYRFNVEEFVPERMKVSASTARDAYTLADTVAVDVEAEYLFGGSAEGSNVEVTCRIRPADFEPKENAEYTYGPASSAPKALDLEVVNAELGAEGKASIACPSLADAAGFDRPAELAASVAVFEAGSGRTTNALAKTSVHPAPYYLGLKTATSEASAGQRFSVDGIVVDLQGKRYDAIVSAEVEYIRLEREYWWYYDEESGESSYGKNVRPVLESRSKVDIKNGKFKLSPTPSESAMAYLVRVTAGDTRTELRLDMSGYYYDDYWDDEDGEYYYRHREDTPRPGKPSTVAIEAPDEIEALQPAAIKFKVPFKGRMLVTAETHRVVTREWHDVEEGTFDWKFTLAEFTPNVYVSALVVKDPTLEGAEVFAPDRAFGLRSIRVKPSTKLHELKITSPEEIRPNSTLEVGIDLGPRDRKTFVTVAAVDEGILSLTRFKTPDPSKQLFAKRALGVDTYETVGWGVQTNPAGPSSRTGGDYDEEGAFGEGPGRIMPVKPVALWSGVVEVPSSGKTTVKFDVPTYRGALRIMAVSADADKTGSAEARVYVRDPLVLQTTLPRFLSAGDEIQIPVFVTNMTGAKKDIAVTLAAENLATPGMISSVSSPMVEFRGETQKSLTLENQKSGTVVFAVRGLRQAGAATFTVRAKTEGFESFDTGDVPFRPNGPLERINKLVELQQGDNDLSQHLTGWVPTSEKSTIWVTAVPYGEAFSHLKYLVRYPYGCIEQTTSSTRPLLYVGNFVDSIAPELVKEKGGLDAMVAHGIKRIFSMQTASGGFAYWPGGTHPDAWGTAYATHMLLDAKKAGFDVPEDRLEAAISYMEKVVERRSDGSDGYGYAEPYLHYSLARVGKGKKARIQKLIDNFPKPKYGYDHEKLFLLKAALYLAGDRRYEKELRSLDASDFKTERETRWSYYSDARRRGFALSLFHDLFGKHKDGEKLARQIARHLGQKPSRYYTTQEITWSITGLGKWVGGDSGAFGNPSLTSGGKELKPISVAKGRDDRTWALYRASEYPDLTLNLGDKKGKVWAMIASAGVRTNSEPKVGGEGLSISRSFKDAEGNEREPDSFELGDMIYAEVKIRNTGSEDLYNLAMVDRFPAGWEVENPRLGRGTLPEWVDEDETWEPDHMNIRDDRLEVFGALPHGASRVLVYAMRATAAGRFQAPPPEIEGMYAPEFWARDEPIVVTVSGPWDALID